MTKRAESPSHGARAELRVWYLGHLRPRLLDAVAAGMVEPGSVADLDVQLSGLFAETRRPRLDSR